MKASTTPSGLDDFYSEAQPAKVVGKCVKLQSAEQCPTRATGGWTRCTSCCASCTSASSTLSIKMFVLVAVPATRRLRVIHHAAVSISICNDRGQAILLEMLDLLQAASVWHFDGPRDLLVAQSSSACTHESLCVPGSTCPGYGASAVPFVRYVKSLTRPPYIARSLPEGAAERCLCNSQGELWT
eukprot:4062635-Amphidinium_carterae.1